MNLFVFGFGYSARHFISCHRNEFVSVSGTVRERDKAGRLADEGINALVWKGDTISPDIIAALNDTDELIVSIPPGGDGDATVRTFGAAIKQAPLLRTIIYLSTIGVYGDHDGGWVDEDSQPNPSSARSRDRLRAEQEWTALATAKGISVHILRLAGIYGPARNAIENVSKGRAKRIIKQGQVFNRIHVTDIGNAIAACLNAPEAGGVHIWNVTDDEPAPPQDVVIYAANLLGQPPPPALDFEDADLSPMARSFYSENKRVSNKRLREELGVVLAYPTYREGLSSLVDTEAGIAAG